MLRLLPVGWPLSFATSKTIHCESGDQVGCSSASPHAVNCRGLLPFAFTTNIASCWNPLPANLRMRLKAIRVPSGEKRGSTSKKPVVMACGLLPSEFITKMEVAKFGSSGKSGEEMNAICVPVGDQLVAS